MEQAGTTCNELKPPGHHVEQIETTWNNKKKKIRNSYQASVPVSALYILWTEKAQ